MSGVVVLCYHGIGSADRQLPLATFRQHLGVLQDHGYRAVSLGDIAALDESSRSLPKAVLITFDDGYPCLEVAAHTLEDFGFQGAAFVISGLVGTKGYANWSLLRQLQRSRVIDVQSHTHSHERWAAHDLQAIEKDLLLSRKVLSEKLERSAEEVRYLAWPWGRCDADWARCASRTGFSLQFLVQTAVMTRIGDGMNLPRICCDSYSPRKLSLLLQGVESRVLASSLNTASRFYRRVRGQITYEY